MKVIHKVILECVNSFNTNYILGVLAHAGAWVDDWSSFNSNDEISLTTPSELYTNRYTQVLVKNNAPAPLP
jgi:hypothetical protein